MGLNTRINGKIHKWSDVTIAIDGKTYRGVQSIEYGVKQTKTNSYGHGTDDPVERFHGRREYSCKLGLSLTTVQQILEAVGDLLNQVVTVTVTFKPHVGKLVTDVINDFEFTEMMRKFSNAAQEQVYEYAGVCGVIEFGTSA